MTFKRCVLIAVAGITLWVQRSSAQCNICDIESVRIAQERLDSLSKEDLSCFIKTFDPSCSSNVEYSEFSNEVLFEVLQRHPGYLVQLVADHPKATGVEYMITRLAAPIHDMIPIQECIKAVSGAEGSSVAKDRIIKSLQAIP